MSRTNLRNRRTTQKTAAGWVRDPRSMIEGARVTFLNATNGVEIVIHDDRGPSLKLRISKGPAGIGFEASALLGSAPISISGNRAEDMASLPPIDTREVSGVIYFSDDWSQAFRAWCRKEGDYPGEPDGRMPTVAEMVSERL